MKLFEDKEDFLNYIMEGSNDNKYAREENARKRFKQKYRFEPDRSSANNAQNIGWITINGRRIRVVMNPSNKYSISKDKDENGKKVDPNYYVYKNQDNDGNITKTVIKNSINFNSDTNTVHISPDFWKLPNDKGRDYAIQHEVGHRVMQHNSGIVDTPKNEKIYKNKKEFKKIKHKSIINKHANPDEYEADAYAISNVKGGNTDEYIKSLKESYKTRKNYDRKIGNSVKYQLHNSAKDTEKNIKNNDNMNKIEKAAANALIKTTNKAMQTVVNKVTPDKSKNGKLDILARNDIKHREKALKSKNVDVHAYKDNSKTRAASREADADAVKESFDDMFNETIEYRLSDPFSPTKVTIYHGSYRPFDYIAPVSLNVGTRLSKPRTSSFWSPDPFLPKFFGLMRAILLYRQERKIEPYDPILWIKWYIDMSKQRIYLDVSKKTEFIESARNVVFYLHEKTIETKYIGIGQFNGYKERTLDIPVRVDKITKMTWDDVKNSIVFTTPQMIDTIESMSRKKNVGAVHSPFDSIIYHAKSKTIRLLDDIKQESSDVIYQESYAKDSFGVVHKDFKKSANESVEGFIDDILGSL